MAEDKYKTPPKMQKSYDKENIGNEGDLAVEEAIKTTERGTRERVDALSDAAKKKRLYESMAFEMGANTVVDIGTSWLAPAPPVYAGVNFIAGGAINTLAQLWRRDDDFSWGELGASSAIGVVPGLGGKATIAKGAIKGGLSGVAHEAVRIGIDEQRLPTAEEAVVGGTIGGVVGGGVTGVIKGAGPLKDKLVQQIDAMPTPFKMAEFAGGTGTGFGPKGDDVIRFQNVAYQKRVINKMIPYGMKRGVMDLKALERVNLGEAKQRAVIQDYLSPSEIAGSYSGFDKANRPEFASLWNDFLKAKGLKTTGAGTDIQVHHINPLYDSIQLFDGVGFNTKEYWDVIETLIKGNARTGVIHRGDDVNNLMMTLGKAKVPTTPHGIAHKYLNEITPTFFDKAEMKLMKADHAYRLQKADKWAEIVVNSEKIILEAHKQWSLLNPKTAIKLSFDDLVDELSNYDDLGYNKLISPDYQLPDMNKIVKEILSTPPERGRPKKALTTLKRIFPNVNPKTGDIQGDLFDQ